MKAAILISMVAMSGGCLMGDDLDATGADPGVDVDVVATPKLATNALTPAQLWNASLSSAVLDQTSADAMADTADGRAALSYVVGCALASGNSITAYAGGIPYTFSGSIGLAPGWKTAALTAAERQWVSACTLARLNLTGTSVTISVRGGSSALAVSPTESAAYATQEGAFFGNVFTTGGFYVAACKGSGTAPSNRRCAQPQLGDTWTECDLHYAGLCSNVCSTTSGYYTSCSVSGVGTFAEAVTSYLP